MGASPVAFLELGRGKSDEFGLTDNRGKLSEFSFQFKPGTGGGANVASIGIALPTEADEDKLFEYLSSNTDRVFWFKFGWKGSITGDSGWIKGYLAKIDYRYNVGQELIMTLHLHSVGSELAGEDANSSYSRSTMTTARSKVGGAGIVAGSTWGSAVVGNLAQLAGNQRDGKVKIKATAATQKLEEAANAMKGHFGATLSFAGGSFSPDMGDVENGDTTFKDIVCMDHLVSEAGFAWTCPPNIMGTPEARGLGDWSSDEINSMWGTRHDAWGASQERAGDDWASRFGFMNEYLETLGSPQTTGGSRGGPGVPDLPAGGGGGLPNLTRDLLGVTGEDENVTSESEDVELINHSGPGESLYLAKNNVMSYINELGAKYGLTNAGQLVMHHEDGDDYGDGGGDGHINGIMDRNTAMGKDVTPKAVASLVDYGVQGVNITIKVGDARSPVESLQCKNDNIIALLPTPHVISTTKLKTQTMGEGGSYSEDLKVVEEEDPADEIDTALDSFSIPAAMDKVIGFIKDSASNLIAYYDANIGNFGAKEVEVEGAPSEKNTGVVSKNKYSSHDNLGSMNISKGAGANAAAAGSDWAKAMWEVRVTCLGIPEISGQHEIQRKVNLIVPSPRGGGGSSRLSGEYWVHDYIHTINANDAFKTTLILKGFPGE